VAKIDHVVAARPINKGCAAIASLKTCYASLNRRSGSGFYGAVCSKRATPTRKAMGCRNRTSGRMLMNQLFGPGGNTTLEYLDRWAAHRAAARAPQRKRPCRARATALDPDFVHERAALIPSPASSRMLATVARLVCVRAYALLSRLRAVNPRMA